MRVSVRGPLLVGTIACDTTNLAWLLKADLANLHTSVFLKVRPGRVNDGDIVFLVA
jgi:hypothetical protein